MSRDGNLGLLFLHTTFLMPVSYRNGRRYRVGSRSDELNVNVYPRRFLGKDVYKQPRV